MPASRRFADFCDGALTFQMDSVPKGGMCLSVFLVLWRDDKRNVLVGKVNRDHNWIRAGALSKEAATKISGRWMLPSSHLLLFESPQDAAKRVLREQLRMKYDELRSTVLQAFSEAYSKPRHWDLEFILQGEIKGELSRGSHSAWNELKFLDVSKMKDSEFARSHQDILAEVGVR